MRIRICLPLNHAECLPPSVLTAEREISSACCRTRQVFWTLSATGVYQNWKQLSDKDLTLPSQHQRLTGRIPSGRGTDSLASLSCRNLQRKKKKMGGLRITLKIKEQAAVNTIKTCWLQSVPGCLGGNNGHWNSWAFKQVAANCLLWGY